MTNCNNCQNYKPKCYLTDFKKENCVNYKLKLPPVTLKEVGLKFWELANSEGRDGCTSLKRYFGINDTRINCIGFKCGNCLDLFVEAINKQRGY